MKDPAVLFYTSDFLSGTYTMSDEQTGKYIRLLCFQHQHGKLSQKDMLSICKAYDVEIWSKFRSENNFFYNERMLIESEKRKKYSESRRKNANNDKKDKAYAKHMGNVNENINVDINILEGGMGGDWESHRRQFLEDGSWQMSFCTKKNISKINLDEKLKEFISDIDLKQDYKPKKELQSHFTNWFNKNKIKHGKSTKSEGIYEAIENLRKSGGYYTGD